MIVHKPPGMLSVPELGERLARQGLRATPVHRLDRDVSGAVILARDEETRAALELFYPASVAAMAEKNWDYSRPRWLHRQFGL